jgi:hypothetical protein
MSVAEYSPRALQFGHVTLNVAGPDISKAPVPVGSVKMAKCWRHFLHANPIYQLPGISAGKVETS